MRIAVILPLVMALLVAAAAHADAGAAVIELDLDGIYGNGPDHWMPGGGDTVDVDVILGGETPVANVSVFRIRIRETGDVECVRCAYRTPDGWRTSVPRGGEEILLHGMDPTFQAPLPIPSVIATLTLRAGADPAGSALSILEGSWFAIATGNRVYPSVEGGTLEIDALSSREASWGVVKDAFR